MNSKLPASMKGESDIIEGLMLAGLAGFFFWFWSNQYDWFSPSDEITHYLQESTCNENGVRCEWHNKHRTVYKVNYEAQSVIYWEHGKVEQMQKLNGCIVRDTDNWKCSNDFNSVGFIDGDWIEKKTKQYRHVGIIDWWIESDKKF